MKKIKTSIPKLFSKPNSQSHVLGFRQGDALAHDATSDRLGPVPPAIQRDANSSGGLQRRASVREARGVRGGEFSCGFCMGFSTVFLWFSYGCLSFSMIFLWFSYYGFLSFSLVFLWFSYGFGVSCPSCFEKIELF